MRYVKIGRQNHYTMTLRHFFTTVKHIAGQFLDQLFPILPEVHALQTLTLEEWRMYAVRIHFHPRHTWCMCIMHFAEPAVRLAIHQMKFHNNIRIARTFAKLLDESVAPFLTTNTDTSNDSGTKLIIPIPISWTRRNERGYNQVELVLAHCTFPYTHGWKVEPHLLRKRPGRSQTKQANTEAREANMRRAFSLDNDDTSRKQIHGADIILIDDVITTGATLAAAREVLLAAGAQSVQAVTFASGI
jgi:ComF family protein